MPHELLSLRWWKCYGLRSNQINLLISIFGSRVTVKPPALCIAIKMLTHSAGKRKGVLPSEPNLTQSSQKIRRLPRRKTWRTTRSTILCATSCALRVRKRRLGRIGACDLFLWEALATEAISIAVNSRTAGIGTAQATLVSGMSHLRDPRLFWTGSGAQLREVIVQRTGNHRITRGAPPV